MMNSYRQNSQNGHSGKNRAFVMFNKLVPRILVKLGNEKPCAVPVYMTLVSLSNNFGCSIVAQSKIASQIHKSTRTVARMVNYLATRHYIAVARAGRTNVYILNYNLIWKNYDYKKSVVGKYIKFPTNVVLTQKQNPGFFKKFDKFVKQNGHKYINLKGVHQKSVKPNADPHGAEKRHKSSRVKRLIKSRKYIPNYDSKSKAKRYHAGYQQKLFSRQNKTANGR